MPQFLKNKYIIVLILITLAIFVLMGVSAGRGLGSNVLKSMISIFANPIQKVFFNAGKNIEDFIRFISEVKTLKLQNEELIALVDRMEEENRRLQELKSENVRLRDALGLAQKFDNYEFIGAQVIAKEPGNWFYTFTIDKGTSEGVENKCAVVTSKGLVGYVYDVNRHSALVMSVIDSDSAVSALIERTRDITIVKGDLVLQHEGLCKMTYISKEADVVAGDSIITSGLGGIYPKGLLIGKIIDIKDDPNEIMKYAIIEPEVDFKRLEEVFVIRKIDTPSF